MVLVTCGVLGGISNDVCEATLCLDIAEDGCNPWSSLGATSGMEERSGVSGKRIASAGTKCCRRRVTEVKAVVKIAACVLLEVIDSRAE